MRIFKNKAFSKWAGKQGLSDAALLTAVAELNKGLVDAYLGGNVYKKRVAIGARGKRGGVRTLLAYKADDKTFFIYGFAKNAQANIKSDELKGLKAYAGQLLKLSDNELAKTLDVGALIEVENDG